MIKAYMYHQPSFVHVCDLVTRTSGVYVFAKRVLDREPKRCEVFYNGKRAGATGCVIHGTLIAKRRGKELRVFVDKHELTDEGCLNLAFNMQISFDELIGLLHKKTEREPVFMTTILKLISDA